MIMQYLEGEALRAKIVREAWWVACRPYICRGLNKERDAVQKKVANEFVEFGAE